MLKVTGVCGITQLIKILLWAYKHGIFSIITSASLIGFTISSLSFSFSFIGLFVLYNNTLIQMHICNNIVHNSTEIKFSFLTISSSLPESIIHSQISSMIRFLRLISHCINKRKITQAQHVPPGLCTVLKRILMHPIVVN